MSLSNDLPESEVNFEANSDLGANAWMCRPCHRYQYQYNDCKCKSNVSLVSRVVKTKPSIIESNQSSSPSVLHFRTISGLQSLETRLR